MNKVYRIAQIGTFDLENYGDLLFPIILENELRERLKDLELILFSPVGGEMPFYGKKVYPIDQIEYHHLEKKIDVIIIGGGDIIRLDENVAADDKYPAHGRTSNLWVFPILLAQKYDIPILFNTPGVPFNLCGANTLFLKGILNSVQYISVRDSISANLIKQIDNRLQVIIAPDSVFLLKNIYPKAKMDKIYCSLFEELELPEKYILFQINHFELGVSVTEYSNILLKLEKQAKIPIVLFPIGYVHEDNHLLDEINLCSNNHFTKIDRRLNPLEMASIIVHSKGFIGTSYHGCLTAHLYNVPAVIINDSKLVKIEGYFNLIGFDEGLCYSIHEVDYPKILYQVNSNLINNVVKKAEQHMNELAIQIINANNYFSTFSPMVNNLISSVLIKKEEFCFVKWGTIYFDLGEGYTEDLRQSVAVIGESPCRLMWTGKVPNGTQKIRLDPVENVACIVASLVVKDESKDFFVYPLNGFQVDGYYYFDNLDPQLEIELSSKLDGLISVSATIYIEERVFIKTLIAEEMQLKRMVNDKEKIIKSQISMMEHMQENGEQLKNVAFTFKEELRKQKEKNDTLKSDLGNLENHYLTKIREKELETTNLLKEINKINNKNTQLQKELECEIEYCHKIEADNRKIYNSKSWKYTSLFRKLFYWIKH